MESALRDRRDGAAPGLIETLRGEADGSVPRLSRHLARLARSAEALGIPLDRERAHAMVLDAAWRARSADRLRLRLHLGPDGALGVTSAPFRLQDPATVWRLAIASEPLDSRDPLRAHKTDRRGVYERARGEHDPAEIEEVLLLNERGEVAEGTITNLFLDRGDGVLLTPPLSSGCLPGIEREMALEEGRAREKTIVPDDLRRARRLLVGNALRGLIEARLVQEP